MSRSLVAVWLSFAVRSTAGMATSLPMASTLLMKPALGESQPAALASGLATPRTYPSPPTHAAHARSFCLCAPHANGSQPFSRLVPVRPSDAELSQATVRRRRRRRLRREPGAAGAALALTNPNPNPDSNPDSSPNPNPNSQQGYGQQQGGYPQQGTYQQQQGQQGFT